MKCTKISLLLIIVALSFVFAQITNANLIQNGSFENSPPFTSNHTFYPGSTGLQGWTIVNGSIDVIISSTWQPAEGNVSLDINGWSTGGISQDFTTIAGHDYQVIFSLAANNGAPSPALLWVSAADMAQTWSVYTTGSTTNMGWMDQSFFFTANSINTTLAFASLTTGASGPALDNVRVSDITSAPVPEPATMILFGAGLTGLVGFARKKKQGKGTPITLKPLRQSDNHQSHIQI